jgi:hypothetical protein
MNGSTNVVSKSPNQTPYCLTLGNVSDWHHRFLFNIGKHLEED